MLSFSQINRRLAQTVMQELILFKIYHTYEFQLRFMNIWLLIGYAFVVLEHEDHLKYEKN